MNVSNLLLVKWDYSVMIFVENHALLDVAVFNTQDTDILDDIGGDLYLSMRLMVIITLLKILSQ